MVIGKRNTCYRPVSWARVACKILQKHTITCVKQILEPCSKLELNHIWFIPSSNGESLSSFRNQFPTSSSQWSNLPSFMSAHRHDLRRRIRHGYPLSSSTVSLTTKLSTAECLSHKGTPSFLTATTQRSQLLVAKTDVKQLRACLTSLFGVISVIMLIAWIFERRLNHLSSCSVPYEYSEATKGTFQRPSQAWKIRGMYSSCARSQISTPHMHPFPGRQDLGGYG